MFESCFCVLDHRLTQVAWYHWSSCFALLRQLTCTSETIPSVTFFTQAAVRAHRILAVSMWAAHVGSIGALIQIFKIIKKEGGNKKTQTKN